MVSSQILQQPQRAEQMVMFFFRAINFSSDTKWVAHVQIFNKILYPIIVASFPVIGTGGLIWVSQWNALQHPVASAFLAALYSDYMLSSGTAKLSCNGDSYKPSELRKFAKSQVRCPCYICFYTYYRLLRCDELPCPRTMIPCKHNNAAFFSSRLIMSWEIIL